ncbi:hypothetical protein K7432_007798 [Basidiobolus ranarum]|uniref:Pleckstrin homology domain-containing protein n=1 Tax=Basidiobolus ranarum TaxID=34480 RepID=A0ABR2WSS8_9FUNG
MNPGNSSHNPYDRSPKLDSTDSEGESLGNLIGTGGPLNLEAVRHLYENTGRNMRNSLANRRSLPSKRTSEAYFRELENLLIEKENEILLAADIGQVLLKEIHNLQAKVTSLENKPYQEAEEIVEEIRNSDRETLKKLKKFRLEAESITTNLNGKPGKFLTAGSPYTPRRNGNSLLESSDADDTKAAYDSSHSELNKTVEAGDSLLEVTKTLQNNLVETEAKLLMYMEMANEHERQAATLGMQINRNVEHEAKLQEATWNMELEIQELKGKLDESETNLNKALHEQKKIHDKWTTAKETIDSYKDREEAHLDNLERTKSRHEQEMTGMRRVISNLQREKTELHKKVDELKVELNGKIQRMGGRLAGSVTPLRDNVKFDPNSPNELSDSENLFNSPTQSPHNIAIQGQSLQMETLNGSLGHAHRTIATLRSSLHREKIEKLELKKMLAESQEKVETMEKEVIWESDNPEAVMRKVNLSVNKKMKMKRRKTNLKDSVTRTNGELSDSKAIVEESFISEDSDSKDQSDHTDSQEEEESNDDDDSIDESMENVTQDPEESFLEEDQSMTDIFNSNVNSSGIKRRRSRPASQKHANRGTTRNPLVSQSTQESPVSTRALFNELSMVDESYGGVEEDPTESSTAIDSKTPIPVKKTVDMGVQVSLLDIHTSRHSKFAMNAKGFLPSRFDFNFSPSDFDSLPFKSFPALFENTEETAAPERSPVESFNIQQYACSTPTKSTFELPNASRKSLVDRDQLTEMESRKRASVLETPNKRGIFGDQSQLQPNSDSAILPHNKYHDNAEISGSVPTISVTKNTTSETFESRSPEDIHPRLHEDSVDNSSVNSQQASTSSDQFEPVTPETKRYANKTTGIENDGTSMDLMTTTAVVEKELINSQNLNRHYEAITSETLNEDGSQSKANSTSSVILEDSSEKANLDQFSQYNDEVGTSGTDQTNTLSNSESLLRREKEPGQPIVEKELTQDHIERPTLRTEQIAPSIHSDVSVQGLNQHVGTLSNDLSEMTTDSAIQSALEISQKPTQSTDSSSINEKPYANKQSSSKLNVQQDRNVEQDVDVITPSVPSSVEVRALNATETPAPFDEQLHPRGDQVSDPTITSHTPHSSVRPYSDNEHSTNVSVTPSITKAGQELAEDTITSVALNSAIQPSHLNNQSIPSSYLTSEDNQKVTGQTMLVNHQSSPRNQNVADVPINSNIVESRISNSIDEHITSNNHSASPITTVENSTSSNDLELPKAVNDVAEQKQSQDMPYIDDSERCVPLPTQHSPMDRDGNMLKETDSQSLSTQRINGKYESNGVIPSVENISQDDGEHSEKPLDDATSSRDQLAPYKTHSRSMRRSVQISQLGTDLIIQGVDYPTDILSNDVVSSQISVNELPSKNESNDPAQPSQNELAFSEMQPESRNTREIGTQTLDSCIQPAMAEPRSPAMKPPPLPGTSRALRQKHATQNSISSKIDKRTSSASESSSDDERIPYNEPIATIHPSTSQTSISQRSVSAHQPPTRNWSIRNSSAMQDHLREHRLSVSAPQSPLLNENRQNSTHEDMETVSLQRRRTIGVDPSIIHAITQTMMGNYMWKYTRKVIGGGISEKKHLRFFWVHPYAKTVNWCAEQSGTDLYRSKSSKTKVQYVTSVRVVLDQPPLPGSTDGNPYSLIIQTPNREMKIKALEKERHDLWLLALTYLQSRQPVAPISANSFRTRRWSAGSNNNSTMESDEERTQHTIASSRSNSSFALPPSQVNNLSRTLSTKHSLSRLFKRPSKATLNPGPESSSSHDPELDDVKKCCQGKHDISQLSSQ